jgi:hypothetical protein
MPISPRPDRRIVQVTPSIHSQDHNPHTRKSNQIFGLSVSRKTQVKQLVKVHLEYPTPASTDGVMFNLPLQISSIPSFKPQVSKIERTERVFRFSDSGSCAAGCPIAGRDPRRNAARFRWNTVATLN